VKQTLHPLVLTLAVAGILCGCTRQPAAPSVTTIAPKAAEWAQQLAWGPSQFSAIRSSALLGVYLTHHLMNEIVFHSALAGVTAQMSFLSESSQEQEESFAILETLGSILQVNVPDMLNRSPVRSTAFDIYVGNLQTLGTQAQSHVDNLEIEMVALNKERREKRSTAAKTQSLLTRAIRDGDFSTAGELQKNLIAQEGEAAVVETQVEEQRSIKNLMNDMIDVAEKRLTVMTANRAALLAGITVIDLPGVEDLGILEKGKRSNGSIFDPATLN